MELTQKKKAIIRLILGFVFATKHYLRSEGGVEHADLQGLLPRSLREFVIQGIPDDCDCGDAVKDDGSSDSSNIPHVLSPRSYSTTALADRNGVDEERVVGLGLAPPTSPTRAKSNSFSFPPTSPTKQERPKPIRRPTAVRVRRPTLSEKKSMASSSGGSSVSERTPLIKSGVRTDNRRTHEEVETQSSTLESAHRLGRMIEVGLPLVIAHEISRSLFRFRRNGNLEDIGPAVSC